MRWGDLVLADSFGLLLSPALLDCPVPSVPGVECDDCRMVRAGRACPTTRCCKVTPPIPNFLVGERLVRGGHPVLHDWIAARRGDPFGLAVPPIIRRQHEEALQHTLFGLPCPLLQPTLGHCSIYETRPALCMGFHCIYPNRLWQEAWGCLYMLLELLQETASTFLVQDASFAQEPLFDASLGQEDAWQGMSLREPLYASLWQHWHGQEEGFYRRCFARLQERSTETFEAIRDIQRAALLARLAQHDELSLAREQAIASEQGHATDSSEPPIDLKERYATGRFLLAQDRHTITEHEQHLLWYLQRLQAEP